MPIAFFRYLIIRPSGILRLNLVYLFLDLKIFFSLPPLSNRKLSKRLESNSYFNKIWGIRLECNVIWGCCFDRNHKKYGHYLVKRILIMPGYFLSGIISIVFHFKPSFTVNNRHESSKKWSLLSIILYVVCSLLDSICIKTRQDFPKKGQQTKFNTNIPNGFPRPFAESKRLFHWLLGRKFDDLIEKLLVTCYTVWISAQKMYVYCTLI